MNQYYFCFCELKNVFYSKSFPDPMQDFGELFSVFVPNQEISQVLKSFWEIFRILLKYNGGNKVFVV